MIAVFANGNLRQQTRRGDAALQQTRGQGGNHRRELRRLEGDELAPDDLMTKKFSRPVIERFTDFLSNTTEGLGLSDDFLRLDDFALDGEILRPTFPALVFALAVWALVLKVR